MPETKRKERCSYQRSSLVYSEIAIKKWNISLYANMYECILLYKREVRERTIFAVNTHVFSDIFLTLAVAFHIIIKYGKLEVGKKRALSPWMKT